MLKILIEVLSPDDDDNKSWNMFAVPAKPSETSGKGEECFGGREEQSCGVPHPGERHLQTQDSAVPVLCVSATAYLVCIRHIKQNNLSKFQCTFNNRLEKNNF